MTIDEIHEYLKYWYDSDSYSDFNMAIDSGFTKYAAYLIYSAGALDERVSETKYIKKLLKRYNPEKDRKDCFGKAIIYVNNKTNEHSFIKNGYVDYLVESEFSKDKDWNQV